MAVNAVGLASTLSGPLVQIVDELFETEEEKATAKLKIMELMERRNLAQLEVNATEAQHKSLFVAGWRPFIGWTCAIALAFSFIAMPAIESAVVYYSYFTGENVPVEGLPKLDWGVLMPLILGMLGLGGLRSYEKSKGVARNS